MNHPTRCHDNALATADEDDLVRLEVSLRVLLPTEAGGAWRFWVYDGDSRIKLWLDPNRTTLASMPYQWTGLPGLRKHTFYLEGYERSLVPEDIWLVTEYRKENNVSRHVYRVTVCTVRLEPIYPTVGYELINPSGIGIGEENTVEFRIDVMPSPAGLEAMWDLQGQTLNIQFRVDWAGGYGMVVTWHEQRGILHLPACGQRLLGCQRGRHYPIQPRCRRTGLKHPGPRGRRV